MGQRQRKFLTYEERFCRFSKSVEKVLLMIIVSFFLLLFTSQSLLQIDSIRSEFVEVERMEGVAS